MDKLQDLTVRTALFAHLDSLLDDILRWQREPPLGYRIYPIAMCQMVLGEP